MLNLGDEQASLTPGRNGPTEFLPLSPKIGGQVNNNRPNIGQYLTREQANFAYKETELGAVINTETSDRN